MNFLGRKKAASASKEKNGENCDISCKCDNHNHGHNQDRNHHDPRNETADYGIILVKKYTVPSALWRKACNDPNHRGVRPKQNKIEEETTGIVDNLTAIFCGACISDKYDVVSNDPDTSGYTGTTTSGDSSDRSESYEEGKNPILLRQDQYHWEQKYKKDIKDLSLLTDVSMLTDGSPIDLSLTKEDEHDDMPTSANLGAKNLPFFPKTPGMKRPVMRASNRESPALSDLSKFTRKNPMWSNKMGAFKSKNHGKKRKTSSSSGKKKKRFPLNQEKPDRRRLV